MLKAVVASLEGLDESVKSLYKKDGDVYRLEIDGMVDKSKLDEFRANNRDLTEKVAKLMQDAEKFKGIDPAKYQELMDKLIGDEEKKLLKDGNIDAVVKMRTEKMIRDYEEQLKAKDKIIGEKTAVAEKAQKERDTYIVEAELLKSVDSAEMGFQPNVAQILKHQVLNEFTFRDGKVIRVKPDGTPIFGKDGNPASINEFLEEIVKDRPYLVKGSSGGGANNNGQGSGNNGAKTMKRSDFDAKSPTEKMRLSKEHIALVD